MKKVLFMAVLLLAGCNSIADLDEGQVSARFQNESVVAENRSSVVVYYAVVNPLTTALWAPCSTPDRCPRIPRESGVTITSDNIPGWDNTVAKLDFYYWQLVPDGNGSHKPDRLRKIALER
jgi:hypothetical protein